MSKIPYVVNNVVEGSTIFISDELKEKLISEWESIGISNDFVFCKVMQDESLLRGLLVRILPDLDVISIEVVQQKSIEIGMDIHGVRFDIYATLADGTVIDIEMQMVNTGSLPRRMRYYGSVADIQMLEKSISYDDLQDQYVIMICPFDLFGQGRHIYTFRKRCVESTELELDDGTTSIVLNASGILDDISNDLKAFLDYVAGKEVDDDYVRKLDAAVTRAKLNKRWRAEYMIASAWVMDHEIIGRQKGLEEGRQIGIEEGRQEIISAMLRNGKTPREIADFCGYPIELVNRIQENMPVKESCTDGV
ncbi:MAG: Rpn family recombination-promoting nuclease/putative transposase [Eubacterium sp.]|nr:Rpn family recombination-promoting nuclease/putative transposase [Eubacterium sp.]